MITKCPPFRTAQIKDPYYRRLCSHDKRAFWKIYDVYYNFDNSFKDLFEKMIERDPEKRISLEQILEHPWVASGDVLSLSSLA
mmetsp:Transcript_23689/g.23390  ORF Transcript_23689/g.23390 Transcript_23689/m.23390 type:complete len:83 (+) Transcript_23689:887-1135(+)